MLTHLKVLVEQSQFGNGLEPVVLLPARDHRLCGCTGAVAENQVLHPAVKEKKEEEETEEEDHRVKVGCGAFRCTECELSFKNHHQILTSYGSKTSWMLFQMAFPPMMMDS